MMEFEKLKIVEYLRRTNPVIYGRVLEVVEMSEYILGRIPAYFPNYTIHDINHSIRVIEYMTNFLNENLSVYSDLQLAIIVYVGLLHDIGMFVTDDEITIAQKKFQNHPDFSTLCENDKKIYLQNYFRAKHGERVNEKLDLKVNSGKTIRSYLFAGNSYDISELISQICQSHTEDFRWIVNHIPNEKRIAFYDVNPQHIAILLRLGDALDIDDRRAPWIIYNAICPKGVSNEEWKKHIPIENYQKVFYLCNNKYEIVFSGKCSEPIIHRKIMDYIKWINDELIHINRALKGYSPPYQFEIQSPLTNKIIPIGFTLSDLQFHLKYEQISKLLMGENLYGSRKEGLRELLQNAIDAVLLMQNICMMYDELYSPCIKIEIDKANKYVIILDNGTGMTQEMLMEYFFNIGNSFYVSKQFKEKNYTYKPIGRYGIGFLACFMLSSKITLITKHYNSLDVVKVEFEKDSSFIILTKCENSSFPARNGTQIILDYDQTICDVFGSEKALLDYVENLILSEGFSFIIQIGTDKKELHTLLPVENAQIINEAGLEISFNANSIVEILTDIHQISGIDKSEIFYSDLSLYGEDLEHDNGFVNLNFLYEAVESFEYWLQEKIEQANQEWIEQDNLNKEFLSELVHDYLFDEDVDLRSNVLDQMLFLYMDDIIDYFLNNHEVFGFFSQKIIEKSKQNGKIIWYEIPYISDPYSLQSFLQCADDLSYEEAYQRYSTHIRRYTVFGKETVEDDLCSAITSYVIELSDQKCDLSYFDEYPFRPERIEYDIVAIPGSASCLPIGKEYDFNKENVHCKVYKNRIWVHNLTLSLPYYIRGLELEWIYININSEEYEINVSRDDLTKRSKELLEKAVGKAIYNWFLENNKNMLTNHERQLIETFIAKYY